MTDPTPYPELDELLDRAFRGQVRITSDELRRRAVEAELPGEQMRRIDSLPEGEYAADEAAEALS